MIGFANKQNPDPNSENICLPYNIENNLNLKSPVIATESDSLATGTTAGDRKLSLVGIVELSGY